SANVGPWESPAPGPPGYQAPERALPAAESLVLDPRQYSISISAGRWFQSMKNSLERGVNDGSQPLDLASRFSREQHEGSIADAPDRRLVPEDLNELLPTPGVGKHE